MKTRLADAPAVAAGAIRPPVPVWERYVCAAGAAVVVTFIDWSQNHDVSALVKTSIGLAKLCGTTPTPSIRLVMLLLFAAVSCLLVFSFMPATRQQALAIGGGVLATLNIGVSAGLTQPVTPSVDAARPAAAAASSISAGLTAWRVLSSAVASLVPAAHAQQANARRDSGHADVWVLVEGLGTYGDVATLNVFSDRGDVVERALVGPAFRVALGAGTYTLVLSRAGHRSVSLKIEHGVRPVLYRMKTEAIALDAQNFLGARPLVATADEGVGRLLTEARLACEQNQVSVVSERLSKLKDNDRARIGRSDRAYKELCMARVGARAPAA